MFSGSSETRYLPELPFARRSYQSAKYSFLSARLRSSRHAREHVTWCWRRVVNAAPHTAQGEVLSGGRGRMARPGSYTISRAA